MDFDDNDEIGPSGHDIQAEEEDLRESLTGLSRVVILLKSCRDQEICKDRGTKALVLTKISRHKAVDILIIHHWY